MICADCGHHHDGRCTVLIPIADGESSTVLCNCVEFVDSSVDFSDADADWDSDWYYDDDYEAFS